MGHRVHERGALPDATIMAQLVVTDGRTSSQGKLSSDLWFRPTLYISTVSLDRI